MMIGTKSVLFGAHCFFLHPWFVAWGWWKLYGFPWDPRLWVAFVVHDLGYWGQPNMDGEEGERHPEWGARSMQLLFDTPLLRLRARAVPALRRVRLISPETAFQWEMDLIVAPTPWRDLALYHSRFYAKADRSRPSPLCIADKLAICLTPAWLYLPMVRATGEIHEYRKVAHARKEAGESVTAQTLSDCEEEWYAAVQEYMRRWIEEHRDGRPDSWTPNMREARDETGVWE